MDGVGDNLKTDNFGERLPQIIRENELQKTIADERMRAEQHKSNYQTLKLDYLRLQQDFASLQKTFEDMNLMREKDKSLLEHVRQEIIKNIKENEHLKTQVLDPQKIKLIQMQVEEKLEESHKEKLLQNKKEGDALKAELNKLKTDHIFLKSEYENDRKQYLNMLEENKMKYEAEMAVLKQERRTRLSHQGEDSLKDFKQMTGLEYENARLLSKIKNIEDENLELRGQKNYSGRQVDSINRVNAKVADEYQSSIKTFEIERQMMKSQIENLHKQIRSISDEKNQAVIQKLDLDKRISSLNNRFEEAEQAHKREVYETRMELLKERGSLEEERNSLRLLCQDAHTELEVMRETIHDLENSLVDKEKEIIRRVQSVKEENWIVIHKLETEIIELEAKLVEFERKCNEIDPKRIQTLENLKNKLLQAEETKEGFERETESLRSKLLNQQILLDQLERENTENANLKNRLSQMESKFKAFTDGEKELLDQNDKLERQLAELTNRRLSSQTDEVRSREVVEREFSEKISLLMEEKCSLHSQVNELKTQVQLAQKKMITAAQLYKEKKNRLKRILLKYKQQLSGLAFKLEQDVDEEKRKLQDSSGDAERLGERLKELLRKNQDFWNIMTSTQMQEKVIGGLPFASISYDFLPYPKENLDWNNLKQKMEDVDEKLRSNWSITKESALD